ncbi:hypothetical protein BRDCF_p1489 [Bacteroidales bacterium CF]|nr:hypothetical protein BRDCF_p1489 [Bacteroidales bacterium CF]
MSIPGINKKTYYITSRLIEINPIFIKDIPDNVLVLGFLHRVKK